MSFVKIEIDPGYYLNSSGERMVLVYPDGSLEISVFPHYHSLSDSNGFIRFNLPLDKTKYIEKILKWTFLGRL